MKRGAVSVILILSISLAFFSTFSMRPAGAMTINVPQDFPTIQDALNFAIDGDIIQVSPGIYSGGFTIKVAVSLIGLDKVGTIIDGNQANHTIRVSANNAHISGFTIRNADKGIYIRRSAGTVVENNILTNCNSSIYVSYGSSGTVVRNNIMAGNLQDGLRMYNATGNTIIGNRVYSNPDGISLGSYTSLNTIANNIVTGNQYGIRIYNSTANTIENNTLSGNVHGLYVFSNSVSNTVQSNQMSNNDYGFQLIDSGNSVLRANIIEGNGNNFWVYGENLEQFVQDIDSSNTVDGKPVYYWVNRQNLQVPLDAGYVAVVNSNNVTVRDLTLTKNYHGVLFAYTNNSLIQNVTVRGNTYGVFLRTSTNDVLSDNVMISNTNDFGVYGTSLSHFVHRVDVSNRVEGKPVYYWVNQTDKTVPPDAGFVGVVNSTNITIKDINLRTNYQGVLLAYTSSSTIQNVSALNNQYGFYLDYSHNNTVSNNTLQYNSYRGLYLYNSTANVISNNKVALNSDTGLKMDWYSDYNVMRDNLVSLNGLGVWLNFSSNNRIYRNNFINNTLQVLSTNGTNTWNNETNAGNFWSDYTGQDLNSDGIGDTLTPHQGLDYYPLVSAQVVTHDIAVISVVPSKIVVGQGFKLSITTSVANLGTQTDTFNLTAYYDNNTMITQIVSLTSGSLVNVTLVWDTTSLPRGNYTISAYAVPVPGEVYSADNRLIGGVVFVGMQGDIAADFGVVDIFDIATVALAFGSTPSDPNWNPVADINNDNKVDIFDVVVVAIHFGEKSP